MYEYELSNKISVKSKLQKKFEFWKSALLANTLVCNILQFGHVIPFVQNPHERILKNNRSAFIHSDFVINAIRELRYSSQLSKIP